MDALIAAMDGKAGDLLLFAADKDKVVFERSWATCVWSWHRQLGPLDKNEYLKFLWVTEFPLLEYSDEENRFTSLCIIRLPCRWTRIFRCWIPIRAQFVQKPAISF